MLKGFTCTTHLDFDPLQTGVAERVWSRGERRSKAAGLNTPLPRWVLLLTVTGYTWKQAELAPRLVVSVNERARVGGILVFTGESPATTIPADRWNGLPPRSIINSRGFWSDPMDTMQVLTRQPAHRDVRSRTAGAPTRA